MAPYVPAPKRARGRLRELKVHFGTFDFIFWCVVGPYEDLADYVKHRHKSDPSWIRGAPAPRGCYFTTSEYAPIIWIPRTPRTPREIGTLAHEVLHIVQITLDRCGIHFGDDTIECYTHMLSYGVTTVLEELRHEAPTPNNGRQVRQGNRALPQRNRRGHVRPLPTLACAPRVPPR